VVLRALEEVFYNLEKGEETFGEILGYCRNMICI
jgi:hypothetical protein